jgi:hypothetical protein
MLRGGKIRSIPARSRLFFVLIRKCAEENFGGNQKEYKRENRERKTLVAPSCSPKHCPGGVLKYFTLEGISVFLTWGSAWGYITFLACYFYRAFLCFGPFRALFFSSFALGFACFACVFPHTFPSFALERNGSEGRTPKVATDHHPRADHDDRKVDHQHGEPRDDFRRGCPSPSAQPHDDEVVVFHDFFVAGLQFLVVPVLVRILRQYGVYLHQLTPNSFVRLNGMYLHQLTPNSFVRLNLYF